MARLDVAGVVNEILMDEFDWPNIYYLPDDRLSLLTWTADAWYGSDLLSLLVRVESRLGVEIRCMEIDYDRVTLGAFVDLIVPLARGTGSKAISDEDGG